MWRITTASARRNAGPIDSFEADSLNGGGTDCTSQYRTRPSRRGKSNWVVIRTMFEACRIGLHHPHYTAPPMHGESSPEITRAGEPLIEPPATRRSWRDVLHVYAEPAALRMFVLGFAAGLPLLLVLGTLSFRLREAGVDRATIGYLSWVGLAYGFKWAWAPLVDRLPLPILTRLLGRRRAWLLLAQLVIVAGLIAMALSDPQAGLRAMTIAALVVAFASATQDIALDAYRIESAARRAAGRSRGDVPDRLSPRDDLGRCRRALDRSRRGGRRSPGTAPARGRRHTSRWRPAWPSASLRCCFRLNRGPPRWRPWLRMAQEGDGCSG